MYFGDPVHRCKWTLFEHIKCVRTQRRELKFQCDVSVPCVPCVVRIFLWAIHRSIVVSIHNDLRMDAIASSGRQTVCSILVVDATAFDSHTSITSPAIVINMLHHFDGKGASLQLLTRYYCSWLEWIREWNWIFTMDAQYLCTLNHEEPIITLRS